MVISRLARSFALMAVLAGSGCRSADRETNEAVAYDVRITDVRGAAIDRSRTGDWVRQETALALARTSSFTAERGAGIESLDVAVAVREVQTPDGPAVRLRLDADVPATLEERLPSLEATVELARSNGTIELRRDIPVALERAAAVLDAKLALALGRSDSIAALLADPDPELVLLALSAAAAQKRTEHADRVVELLEHDDERVAAEAVESLGTLGEQRHVPALIAAAKLSDRGRTSRLYEALAELGGPDALGFLAFAAANEDDPGLARLARQQLDRLRGVERQAPRRAGPRIVRGHR